MGIFTYINAGGDLTLAQATDTHSESQSNVNGSANLKVGTTPESKDYGAYQAFRMASAKLLNLE